MAWPYITDSTGMHKEPLKYLMGDEKAKSAVIYASTVAVNENLQRLIFPGTVLVKITSGLGANKYGPYSKTATDGRQSLNAGAVLIAQNGENVTLGDKAVAGWFMDAVFDMSELTTNGISLHGASLTSLKAALSQCIFED